MSVKKIMHNYYKSKLDEIEDIKPFILPDAIPQEQETSALPVGWDNILGWVVMIGMIVHFVVYNSFFEIAGFMPISAILF